MKNSSQGRHIFSPHPAGDFTELLRSVHGSPAADKLDKLCELGEAMLEAPDLSSVAAATLDAVIAIIGADKGTMQAYDVSAQGLRFIAHRGFDPALLAGLPLIVAADDTPCGRALAARSRIIVEDYESDVANASHRATAAALGYRAAQSTPLMNRRGELLGMLSTHWRDCHTPDEQELRLIDLYVRFAVERLERARAEEETRNLYERMEQQWRIFDTTLSGIVDFAYTFDCDGRFVYVNKALLDLWGLHLEEAVGKNFFDLKYPDDLAARLQQQIQQVFETGEGLSDETPYTSPTGKGGYYEYIFRPVFSADGRVELVAGSTRDITLRKQTEEALRDARAQLETALGAAEIGTWMWDIQNDRMVADRNAARFFSLTPQEAAGTPIATYFRALHPDDRARVEAEVAMGLQRGQYEMEYRILQPDGAIRWVVARGKVQYDDARNPARFPGVIIDITGRKLAEDRLRRTSLELERFVSIASHDLKEPLRGVALLASFIAEDDRSALSPQSIDRLGRIRQLCSRLTSMIDGLLQYARAGGKRRNEPCDLEEIARRSVDKLADSLRARNAEVILTCRLPTISGDPLLLERIFANLVMNAVKYNESAVKRVEIGCEDGDGGAAADPDETCEGDAGGIAGNGGAAASAQRALTASGRGVTVFVRDNGIGIDPRHHRSVFTLFKRISPAAPASGAEPPLDSEGVGLGLALVKNIIESHGGSIALRSAPGKGSTFLLHFPGATLPDLHSPSVVTLVRAAVADGG